MKFRVVKASDKRKPIFVCLSEKRNIEKKNLETQIGQINAGALRAHADGYGGECPTAVGTAGCNKG